jgi:hypothetical protein
MLASLLWPVNSSARLAAQRRIILIGGGSVRFYAFVGGGAAMRGQLHLQPTIVAAAERQMRNSVLASESLERADRREVDGRGAPAELMYVAISREAGAGGSEVGQCLGQRLGWNVFGKNLLDHVAQRFDLCRDMLDAVDETRGNWVYDMFGTWMDGKLVAHEMYFTDLRRTVAALASRGHAVFVGRGSQFLLPRDLTLAVRLVASLPYRVQNMMQITGMEEKEARQCVIDLDAGRHEFVKRFLHRDVADPHHYDLVISIDRCGKEAAVAQILAAMKR